MTRYPPYRPTGDCFSVEKIGADTFLVIHFPNHETRRSCCRVRVTMNAADRAKAIPEADPHGEAACLLRAGAMIEAKHKARR